MAVMKQATLSLGGFYHPLFRVKKTGLPLQHRGLCEQGHHLWSYGLSPKAARAGEQVGLKLAPHRGVES